MTLVGTCPLPTHSPWSDYDCVSVWPDTRLARDDVFTFISQFEYNADVCRDLCQLQASRATCDCVWQNYDALSLLYFIREVDAATNKSCIAPVCDTDDESVVSCLKGSLLAQEDLGCPAWRSSKHTGVHLYPRRNPQNGRLLPDDTADILCGAIATAKENQIDRCLKEALRCGF